MRVVYLTRSINWVLERRPGRLSTHQNRFDGDNGILCSCDLVEVWDDDCEWDLVYELGRRSPHSHRCWDRLRWFGFRTTFPR
jgi:hypothetical protein